MEETDKSEVNSLQMQLVQQSSFQENKKQQKGEQLMINNFYELLPTFQDEINEEKSGICSTQLNSQKDTQHKQFKSPLGASETTKSGTQQNLKMQTIFDELMQQQLYQNEVKQIGEETNFGSQCMDQNVEEVPFKRSSQQKLTFPFQNNDKNGKNGNGQKTNPNQEGAEMQLDQVRSLIDCNLMSEQIKHSSPPPGLTFTNITPAKKKKPLNINAQQFFSTKQEQKQKSEFSFWNLDQSEKTQKQFQTQQNELDLISYSCDEFNKLYQFQQKEQLQQCALGPQNQAQIQGSLSSFSQPGLIIRQQQQQQQQQINQQQQQQQQQFQPSSFQYSQPRYYSTAELEQMSYQFPNQQQQQLQPKMQFQQQIIAPGPSIQANDRKPIILEATPQKFIGVLKYFDVVRHYGFIVSEQQNQEIFFHLQDITHPLLTKEFLSSFKDGNVIKLSFTICTYIGKYNISKKAINIEPLL